MHCNAIFLEEYLSKKHLFIKRSKNSIEQMMDWNDLNNILNQHRLPYPQLRIINKGSEIPAGVYTIQQPLKSNTIRISLENTAIYDLLNAEATLVIDAIDEMIPKVQEFAETLEFVVQETVEANVYASFAKNSFGFDVHWDDHDVVVVQMQGKKRWKVYGFTERYPPAGKGVDSIKPVTPIWEGVMEAGDILYMPRGCWHKAEAMGETLHITFGFTNKTGGDLISWVKKELQSSDLMRRDLPRFSEHEQESYLADLLSLISGFLNKNNLKRFNKEVNERARVKQNFSLPLPINEFDVPFEPGTKIFLSAPRLTEESIILKDESFSFCALAKRFEFSTSAYPLFREIVLKRSVNLIAYYSAMMREGYTKEDVTLFIKEFVKIGLLRTRRKATN